MNNIMKNGNKGFSLVELIVVIAIMAVMTSVLAPALLGYVERSRAQKDDSAMSEVVNAVMLAMSDQDVYDEMLYYCTKGNVSSYMDSEADATKNVIITKAAKANGGAITDGTYAAGTAPDQIMYDDNARLADEEEYLMVGNMRGVTITFSPEKNSNASEYILSKGEVNAFVHGTKKDDGIHEDRLASDTIEYFTVADPYDAATHGTAIAEGDALTFDAVKTSGNPNTYLYNRVRATIGDSVPLTSQTYRNSEYTIFIRMGSTGGNAATAQDAIAVYGQWNGTNLPAGN